MQGDRAARDRFAGAFERTEPPRQPRNFKSDVPDCLRKTYEELRTPANDWPIKRLQKVAPDVCTNWLVGRGCNGTIKQGTMACPRRHEWPRGMTPRHLEDLGVVWRERGGREPPPPPPHRGA